MPTLAYVGTPARDGALAAKRGGQKDKGAPAMVERIPTTALLPRIGSGPLKDVSNSSRQLSNIAYLMKVSDKWTAGKGKHQSNECKTAIRLCLVNGFRSTDIAHHVAVKFKHFGFEVQTREFQRVQDTVDRIERKLWLTQLSRFNSNKEAAFFI
mmetsp:Transcript_24865/g.37676  ORF Transcript_24865/g.37676 Transcript_24865/m.37676 type:complete len:154 (-) Transcript_24865:31-492(-)